MIFCIQSALKIFSTYDKQISPARNEKQFFSILGEYRVNLPDGRVQIVSYTASAEKGYVANVRYDFFLF